MEIKNATYEVTAVKPEQYPKNPLPEIALVGRSNVGKSSLINRRNLARVSSTPGKTREINFYNIEQHLYLADLPGYGYAAVSKAVKAGWNEMIETYLHSRSQLKLILMLVDIRHTPSPEDRMMYAWLASQDKPSLVLAMKLDKISHGQVMSRLKEIRAALVMPETETITPVSAETKQGVDEVWSQIRQITDVLIDYQARIK